MLSRTQWCWGLYFIHRGQYNSVAVPKKRNEEKRRVAVHIGRWIHLQCCAKCCPVATPSLAANSCSAPPCTVAHELMILLTVGLDCYYIRWSFFTSLVVDIHLGNMGSVKGWLNHAWAACFAKHSAQAEKFEKLVSGEECLSVHTMTVLQTRTQSRMYPVLAPA